MNTFLPKTVAIIVAHPDDETLWAGCTILTHPLWQWHIISLSRETDLERSLKFYSAMKIYNALGRMGNLNDDPQQTPLKDSHVKKIVLDLIPAIHFDLIITHNPSGEYNRHRRHEETSKAVIQLWHANKIETKELWTFAYRQEADQLFSTAIKHAPLYTQYSLIDFAKKSDILHRIYGFQADSFEFKTNPNPEAFWQFNNSSDAMKWLNDGGLQ